MFSLQKLLYFFIAMALGMYFFLSYKTGKFSLYPEMKFLYALFLLPFFGMLYNTLFEKRSWRELWYKKNVLSRLATFVALIVFLLML